MPRTHGDPSDWPIVRKSRVMIGILASCLSATSQIIIPVILFATGTSGVQVSAACGGYIGGYICRRVEYQTTYKFIQTVPGQGASCSMQLVSVHVHQCLRCNDSDELYVPH